jgi:hypothetical protein
MKNQPPLFPPLPENPTSQQSVQAMYHKDSKMRQLMGKSQVDELSIPLLDIYNHLLSFAHQGILTIGDLGCGELGITESINSQLRKQGIGLNHIGVDLSDIDPKEGYSFIRGNLLELPQSLIGDTKFHAALLVYVSRYFTLKALNEVTTRNDRLLAACYTVLAEFAQIPQYSKAIDDYSLSFGEYAQGPNWGMDLLAAKLYFFALWCQTLVPGGKLFATETTESPNNYVSPLLHPTVINKGAAISDLVDFQRKQGVTWYAPLAILSTGAFNSQQFLNTLNTKEVRAVHLKEGYFNPSAKVFLEILLPALMRLLGSGYRFSLIHNFKGSSSICFYIERIANGSESGPVNWKE